MQQEVVLALLAKEPSHGYELRARLRQALGPLGEAMNDGQIYVTLTRLEKAGLVTCEQAAGLADRPDRKVYALTAANSGKNAGSGEAISAKLILRSASSTARLMRRQFVTTGQSDSMSHRSWVLHSVSAIGPSSAVMTSATVMSCGERARLNPPLAPRWGTSRPSRARIFKILLTVGCGR